MEIIQAEECHALEIAPRLNRVDADNIQFMGRDVLSTVKKTVQEARKAWAAVYKNEVIAVFGVTDLNKTAGTSWCYTLDKMPDVKIGFLRNSKKYITRMLKYYSTLISVVDERNSQILAWLKWCGYSVYPSEQVSEIFGRPFYHCELKKRN